MRAAQQLTLFAEASPAKTFRSPAANEVSAPSGADFGGSSGGSSASSGPRFVFVENVHGGWRKWLPIVRRSLWKVGYASVPLRVLAAQAGAPHRRARCFLLAYANGVPVGSSAGGAGGEGRPDPSVTQDDGSSRDAADSDGLVGLPGRQVHRRRESGGRPESGIAGPPWIARDANAMWQLQPSGSVGEQWRWTRHADGWAFESPIPGVDDGTPDRLDRERLCGNGAVPQQVAVAWRTLMALAARTAGATP